MGDTGDIFTKRLSTDILFFWYFRQKPLKYYFMNMTIIVF